MGNIAGGGQSGGGIFNSNSQGVIHLLNGSTVSGNTPGRVGGGGGGTGGGSDDCVGTGPGGAGGCAAPWLCSLSRDPITLLENARRHRRRGASPKARVTLRTRWRDYLTLSRSPHDSTATTGWRHWRCGLAHSGAPASDRSRAPGGFRYARSTAAPGSHHSAFRQARRADRRPRYRDAGARGEWFLFMKAGLGVIDVTALALLGLANVVLPLQHPARGAGMAMLRRVLPLLVLLMFVALVASTAVYWASDEAPPSAASSSAGSRRGRALGAALDAAVAGMVPARYSLGARKLPGPERGQQREGENADGFAGDPSTAADSGPWRSCPSFSRRAAPGTWRGHRIGIGMTLEFSRPVSGETPTNFAAACGTPGGSVHEGTNDTGGAQTTCTMPNGDANTCDWQLQRCHAICHSAEEVARSCETWPGWRHGCARLLHPLRLRDVTPDDRVSTRRACTITLRTIVMTSR